MVLHGETSVHRQEFGNVGVGVGTCVDVVLVAGDVDVDVLVGLDAIVDPPPMLSRILSHLLLG